MASIALASMQVSLLFSFSSWHPWLVVDLHIAQEIKAGTEVTFDYGDQFFKGENEAK
jgi:hypothetical protein